MIIYKDIFFIKINILMIKHHRVFLVLLGMVVFVVAYYMFVNDEVNAHIKNQRKIEKLTVVARQYKILKYNESLTSVFSNKTLFLLNKTFKTVRNILSENNFVSVRITPLETGHKSFMVFNVLLKGPCVRLIDVIKSFIDEKSFLIENYSVESDQNNNEYLILYLQMVVRNEFN